MKKPPRLLEGQLFPIVLHVALTQVATTTTSQSISPTHDNITRLESQNLLEVSTMKHAIIVQHVVFARHSAQHSLLQRGVHSFRRKILVNYVL
eukprot:1648808-Amphidinium_carterae.1